MKDRCVKYFLVFVFCMFVSPLITHASCDYQRMAELSKIASNVQFNYSYEVKTVLQTDLHGNPWEYTDVFFNVDISNINNDIYIVDNSGNIFESDATYAYGRIDEVEYVIYSKDAMCVNEKLLTRHVSFPKRNYYYFSDACKQYPDFEYCKLWINLDSMDEDAFNQKLNLYKEKLNDNQNSQSTVSSDLNDNLKIILLASGIGVLLFAFVFLFLFFLKKRNKS